MVSSHQRKNQHSSALKRYSAPELKVEECCLTPSVPHPGILRRDHGDVRGVRLAADAEEQVVTEQK